MKNFFSGINFIVSLSALALSGLTFFKVTTIENQLPETIAAALPEQPSVKSRPDSDAASDVGNSTVEQTPAVDVSPATANEGTTEAANSDETVAAPSVDIQLGQFSQSGYDNQIMVELVSVKRLPPDEEGARDRVNVNLRVRRTVEEITPNYPLSLPISKGRNPETNEVYKVKDNQATRVHAMRVPSDAWADAYFWLSVPDNVSVIDIVVPETAIFEGVPIAE
ncbi:MAG: hypothetical protein AAFV72_14020 [Cyanobacteria bacterium J06635_1]